MTLVVNNLTEVNEKSGRQLKGGDEVVRSCRRKRWLRVWRSLYIAFYSQLWTHAQRDRYSSDFSDWITLQR